MRRLAMVPREILYFGGIGLYGFAIGIVYWFVTYEVAGAILLTVFGAAAVGLALLLAVSVRGRQRDASGDPATTEAGVEGSFASAPGRIPGSSLAPLEVGVGIAVCSLSLAFGIWMLIGGIVPFVAGAYSWIRNAERELISTSLDDQADVADPGPAAGHAGRTDPAGPAGPPDARAVSGGRPAAEPPSA